MADLQKNKLIDIGFHIGLLLKGLFAAGEIIGGIAMNFLTPENMNRLIVWVLGDELIENPQDWLTEKIVLFGQTYSGSAQHFAMFYLVSHGVIKLAVIILLWEKKLWAYPVSVVVFVGFIVYQLHSFAQSYSVMMLLVTLLDIVMIALTILEYKRMKGEKA